jgi:four helix bundle protein
MKRQYGFEKLSVWQNSRKLVKHIYSLTKGLPPEERFGLINQIQRAIVSVNSNIAEGASRTSNKDQGHFYQTAYASLMEVLCQLTLCLDLDYITESSYQSTREKIDMAAYQLNQLRATALSKPSKPPQLSQPRSKDVL